MGESLVERPTAEKRMDESVKSSGGLEVSVSFGRFENDILSWEKWSSFSPNKYLEEVGNLSTPGSVAQKKAYFEAHYKKIAARKAEELEHEKSMNLGTTSSLDESSNDDCRESSGIDAEFGFLIGERSANDAAQKEYVAPATDAAFDHDAKDDNCDYDKGIGGKDGAFIEVECGNCLLEEAKDELNVNVVDLESIATVEASSVEVETRSKDSLQTKEKATERKHGAKQASPKLNAKGGVRQKVTSCKRETNPTMIQKKAVPPAVKPLPASTPKHLKTTSVSTPMAASKSSTKKVNGSPVTKSKTLASGRSKRAVSSSLHMSLNLGPANHLPAQSMTRKSLIMETNGDKDVIRRAFKTFQNRGIGSSNDGKSSTPKQVKLAAVDSKIPTPPASRKKANERLNDSEKMSDQRRSRSNPLQTGSSRSSVVDKKNTMATSSAINFRSDERAEKRKEFLKKLEAKSVARAAENAQLTAKTKEQKESEIKKLRKSLNFKAKPLPSFYKGETTKARLEKVCSSKTTENEVRRQPTQSD